MADFPDEAWDEDIVVRIYDGVWVGLDEKSDDGSCVVQYLHGEPPSPDDVEEFQEMLEVAAGMFVVSPETIVNEVRPTRPEDSLGLRARSGTKSPDPDAR
ncbi:MAG: hypothetical protein DWQ45_06145 [Planctomycetota bacterium]|nr:MAG: hypothetical protein DWQ45_06145 [Planctomycetota bacterium]